MADGLDVGFQNGSIRLEEIPTVYYSGQTINGSVVFDLRTPLTFSALYIQFIGEADVQWTETEIETVHGRQQHKLIKYQAREEYFNYTETIAGGYGTSQLPRTYQTFPFKYQIPFTCPSSFEGCRGCISYSIIATMVYPDTTKEELKKEITVVAPLDLNTGSPRLKEPIDLEFEEMYDCFCFCSSDPVTIRIRLPVSGYCPGQAIPAAIEVQNNSNVEITKMIFQILSKELYRSMQPVSSYVVPETVIATTKTGAMMANCKTNFTCYIVVPDMIAPNLENCSIIDVGYFIRVTIKLSGCNKELRDEAEICLGLVPIRETLEHEYKHPMAENLPSGPIPIDDGTSAPPIPPIVTPRLTGSSTSINRSQRNLAQSAPYQTPPAFPGVNMHYPAESTPDLAGSNHSINRNRHSMTNTYDDPPPPYPGRSAPYPTDNKYPIPGASEQKPSYEIGFKIDGLAGYPGSSTSLGSPPYPTTNLMPGVQLPYPTNNAMPQVNTPSNKSSLPPYPKGEYTPSAPPAPE